MSASNETTLRRSIGRHAVAWSALAVLGVFVASRSHVAIAEWVEPVRAEIPDWTRLSLGLPTDERIPNYALVVSPDVLRAAHLLQPSDPSATADRANWWFEGRLLVAGHPYDVEVQLVATPPGQQGLRVRFTDRDRPAGMQGLEFESAGADRQLRQLAGNAAARDAGLIVAPDGLARLRINGSKPRLVRWSETNSRAMLQRLGYPKGEIFRLTARSQAGDPTTAPYRPTIERHPPMAQSAALERLLSLVHTADDARFRAEIEQVVAVEEVLAWSALSRLFGEADTSASPDWYFDPITGRLLPIVRSLTDSAPGTAADSSAQRLVARLITDPALRARRDQQLTRWIGAARSAGLEAADRRIADWVAQWAAVETPLERATSLPALARLRRAIRHDLGQRAELLRRAFGSLATSAPLAPSVASSGAIARWVARSGLPWQIDGDTLVLPAGEHTLRRTLTVPATHRLVIAPGTRLHMGPEVSLLTFRRIEALGTRDAPIEIAGLDASKPWGTIGVVRAPGTSLLAHLTISGGSDDRIQGIEFTGALSFNASDVILRDSDVRNCHGDDAMSVRRANFQVERSRFIDNASDGFDAEWAAGSVERSLFANNGDDGLDLATTEARVHRGWFRGMGDKALSAGERSDVTVTDSQLVDSQIAIASKEDSTVAVRSSEIRRNEIGISLYRDNRVFGSGYGTIDGGLFAENLRDFAVEPGSGLTLNGVERLQSGTAGVLIGLREPLDSATRSVQ